CALKPWKVLWIKLTCTAHDTSRELLHFSTYFSTDFVIKFRMLDNLLNYYSRIRRYSVPTIYTIFAILSVFSILAIPTILAIFPIEVILTLYGGVTILSLWSTRTRNSYLFNCVYFLDNSYICTV